MSELKSYDLVDIQDYRGEVYLKDEADLALANKDREITELKKSIGRLLKMDTEQVIDEVVRKTLIYGDGLVPVEHAMRFVVEVQHQKYKRCLNEASYWVAVSYQCVDDKHRKRAEKNHYKWLKLAEKFKEQK